MLSKNRIRKYKTWARARPRTMPDARIGAKTTRQRLIWRGGDEIVRRSRVMRYYEPDAWRIMTGAYLPASYDRTSQKRKRAAMVHV